MRLGKGIGSWSGLGTYPLASQKLALTLYPPMFDGRLHSALGLTRLPADIGFSRTCLTGIILGLRPLQFFRFIISDFSLECLTDDYTRP